MNLLPYQTDDWPALPPLSALVNRVHCMDALELLALLPDASVDCVITDPPYPKEFLHLYEIIARESARILKPGGSLLAMAGQSYLPDILQLMTPHLRYHWMINYLMLGGQAVQIWPRKVNTFWKPVLWFVAGEYTGAWVGDVIKSLANDKRFHHWGQSESGMRGLIERFTRPGDLIIDPFAGGGSTLAVAQACGRRFIGGDTSGEHVQTARERLSFPYTPNMFDALPPAASE